MNATVYLYLRARVYETLCIGNYVILSAIWNNKHKQIFSKMTKIGLVQFVVFSAYLFQIAQEKSCGHLLIIYMKNFKMVKQKKGMLIMQSGKNSALNCTIQGACLILKQKI